MSPSPWKHSSQIGQRPVGPQRPHQDAASHASRTAEEGAEQSSPKLPVRGSTNAKPVLQILDSEDGTAVKDAEIQRCFWWLLGTLESASDHPVAKSILAAVHQMDGLPPVIAPRDFEYISGRGIKCVVEHLGGVTACVGNMKFFEDTAQATATSVPPVPANTELLEWVTLQQKAACTTVLLHVGGELLGAVAIRDPIRHDARWFVKFLQDRLRLDVWLCSGDNTATAQCIAGEVGIANVVAEALPASKSECVRHLQHRKAGCKVGFLGDGVNDAPALAQADVGIAIGAGARVAMEAADVVLVRSELSDCIAFLALSFATFRTICLNFFWAFCFNFVCLPLAAGIFYPHVYIPPLVAGIAMACSSFLVVMSSLLLKRFKPPQPPPNVTASRRAAVPEQDGEGSPLFARSLGSSTQDKTLPRPALRGKAAVEKAPRPAILGKAAGSRRKNYEPIA